MMFYAMRLTLCWLVGLMVENMGCVPNFLLTVREMKYRGSEVGGILGVSEPGIMKCVDRGSKMLKDAPELRSKLIS
jgi:hypothetical protein